MEIKNQYSVFASFQRLANGSIDEAVRAAREHLDRNPEVPVLIFNNETGKQEDFDLSGSVEDAVARAVPRPKQGRGRPKLGVDCGEICLLPRHWAWLEAQPRSASATIRRLIDVARKSAGKQDRVRERIAVTDRFLWGMAGNLPGYEEASRALYAQNWADFSELTSAWPEDIRSHVDFLLKKYPAGQATE
ncbi:MAG: DUF2239 family protein [Spirochaetales bacterium]|nr:DUF2239 family protein [Spirochaetales bacterium]